MAEVRSVLGQVELFSGLSAKQLVALERVVVARTVSTGDVLFLQDEKASGFYILLEGALQVYRTGMDGRRQILHVFDSAGDVCGEVPVFEGTVYPATAEAARNSSIIHVPRDPFLQVARAQPEILLGMLAVLSRRIRRFVGLIDDLSLKDVGTRLAQYLVGLREESGRDKLTLPVSKGMLASQLGTIAETVSRTLRKMQEQELIRVDGRQIEILDATQLQEIADGVEAL